MIADVQAQWRRLAATAVVFSRYPTLTFGVSKLDAQQGKVSCHDKVKDGEVAELVWEIPDGGHEAEIAWLWVEPEWRRQGLASAMLDVARDAVPYAIYHSESLSESGKQFARAYAKLGAVRYVPEAHEDASCYANAAYIEDVVPGARYAEGWARNPAEGREWANRVAVAPNGDILDATWSDANDSFEYVEVKNNSGAPGGERYYERGLGKPTAKLGISWRPIHAEPYWLRQHDVTISSEGGIGAQELRGLRAGQALCQSPHLA